MAAQQISAIWAAVMGGVSVIGVVISTYGVYLILTNYQETKKAAAASNSTLRAYIAKERRRVTVVNIEQSATAPNIDSDIFFIRVKNSGDSDLAIIIIQYQILNENEWPDEFRLLKNSNIILEEAEQATISDIDIETSLKTSENHFLCGIIAYITLDSQMFETPFCYRLEHYADDGSRGFEWVAIPSFAIHMPEPT